MEKTLIIILYDSIANSVFESQVAEPLQTNYGEYATITIVSFERVNTEVLVQNLQVRYPKLKFIIYKRSAFFGLLSLVAPSLKLRIFLHKQKNYDLLARGPHAGVIAYWAQTKQCQQIVIQARGLLAEEYCYAHKIINSDNNNLLLKFIGWVKHKLITMRSWQYYNLEKYIYAKNRCTIEAVSPALKEYLIKKFGCHESCITVAYKDIPKQISKEQKIAWRQEIRRRLNINDSTYVYCYNGSAKTWQCIQETIEYFIALSIQDKFLLVLTQEPEIIQKVLVTSSVTIGDYAIIVARDTKELYSHLAACDYGIIFRHAHAINWVARPTKVLEYQAVCLKIIHNNTIAYIQN